MNRIVDLLNKYTEIYTYTYSIPIPIHIPKFFYFYKNKTFN